MLVKGIVQPNMNLFLKIAHRWAVTYRLFVCLIVCCDSSCFYNKNRFLNSTCKLLVHMTGAVLQVFCHTIDVYGKQFIIYFAFK